MARKAGTSSVRKSGTLSYLSLFSVISTAMLVGAILFPTPALGAVTISLSPPYVEQVARPGGEIQGVIAYENLGDQPVAATVELADFAVNENGEVIELPAGVDSSSLAPYMKVSPPRVEVVPGQRVHFRYSIAPPPEFGQLRAQLYVTSVPTTVAAGNQVVVAPRMGVPVYLENADAAPPSLEVGAVAWERHPDDPGQILLRLSVKNTGGRNIRPDGFVQVRSPDRSVANFDFNQGNEPVLPGQVRQWQFIFGPVSPGALSVSLRFETSPRDQFAASADLPAAAGE